MQVAAGRVPGGVSTSTPPVHMRRNHPPSACGSRSSRTAVAGRSTVIGGYSGLSGEGGGCRAHLAVDEGRGRAPLAGDDEVLDGVIDLRHRHVEERQIRHRAHGEVPGAGGGPCRAPWRALHRGSPRAAAAPRGRGSRSPAPAPAGAAPTRRPADRARGWMPASQCPRRGALPSSRYAATGGSSSPMTAFERGQRDRRASRPQDRPIAGGHVDAVRECGSRGPAHELVDELRRPVPKPSSRNARKLAGRCSCQGTASPCSRSKAASPRCR